MAPAKKSGAEKGTEVIKKIHKRNGEIVAYNQEKIFNVVNKAMIATGEGSESEARDVARNVHSELMRIAKKFKFFMPDVEGIQDIVEKQLILAEYVKTAKAYILYRAERNKERAKRNIAVPADVKKLADESKKSFRNPLGEFIYYRTYSRWLETESRRETWVETVDRYINFMRERLGKKLKEEEYSEVRKAILMHEAMPSMRALQFSGDALRKNHASTYNCSFTAPETYQDFAEIMFLSMSGCGVGFSAESYNSQSLPQIKFQSGKKHKFVIPDTREGWSDSLAFGMKKWFEGEDAEFDYSLLRPAGARLKTTGGKSSGPAPLIEIHNFTRAKILSKQGKHLSNLDVHDIVCQIGLGVVSGGVRRTALISLSDLNDDQIRDAKKGQFWINEPQRSLSNNSAVYNEQPSLIEFLDEWTALIKSQSGERGIFNRGCLAKTLPERRLAISKPWMHRFGTNPCGEIILRPKQFCNLSEVVARHEDKVSDLMRKIKIATILGTYQSTFTDFVYLSPEWKQNCMDERLLGVSITGMWDCPEVRKPEVLRKLRDESIRVNKLYAKKFGVNPSTAITCVKPSGNLSQTVDCSSGMHPRHSQFYIRRVRISENDALFQMMKDQGVPYHPEVGQTMETATTFVVDFPVKAPKGSIFKNDMTAMEQLEFWKMVKENFTEHNPSVTISVGPEEWLEVGNWIYKNWDISGGLSFLPRSNHVYQLAPYEECDEKAYNELMKKYEGLDFSRIVIYEKVDGTDAKKELACAGGNCEVEDLAVLAPKVEVVK